MRNLLVTRRGRFASFFLLYATEGLPVGFSAVAVATYMRRQGISPEAIGLFVATLYLPWSWKWAMGPFVDVLRSDRFGPRRTWIFVAQLMMALTLLLAMPIEPAARLGLFTWIILVHNVFAATQDVAIDALAVSSLKPDERGFANGLMFAGAYIGSAIGGAGTLKLVAAFEISFNSSFLFVAGAILLVTLLITLRIREPRVPRPAALEGSAASPSSAAQISGYFKIVFREFFGTRIGFLGLLFALLPAGSYALSLALQSSLAVELGLTNDNIANLSLWSTVLAAAGCVGGGLLSDRFGRRRMMTLYIIATAVPAVWLAWIMSKQGWVMPVSPTATTRPEAPAALVSAFWSAGLAYSFIHGLMYGTRTALFMDLCNPAVAATQFTAYMSMLNLAIAYSAYWQGYVIMRLGYPSTLLLDAAIGCVSLTLLPFLKRRSESVPVQFEEAAKMPAPRVVASSEASSTT